MTTRISSVKKIVHIFFSIRFPTSLSMQVKGFYFWDFLVVQRTWYRYNASHNNNLTKRNNRILWDHGKKGTRYLNFFKKKKKKNKYKKLQSSLLLSEKNFSHKRLDYPSHIRYFFLLCCRFGDDDIMVYVVVVSV